MNTPRCRWCQDAGKIQLFSSTVACSDCPPATLSPLALELLQDPQYRRGTEESLVAAVQLATGVSTKIDVDEQNPYAFWVSTHRKTTAEEDANIRATMREVAPVTSHFAGIREIPAPTVTMLKEPVPSVTGSTYRTVYRAAVEDNRRRTNRAVALAAAGPGPAMIVVKTLRHANNVMAALSGTSRARLFTGACSLQQREEARQGVADGHVDVIVATKACVSGHRFDNLRTVVYLAATGRPDMVSAPTAAAIYEARDSQRVDARPSDTPRPPSAQRRSRRTPGG